jgi:hypothetical protein
MKLGTNLLDLVPRQGLLPYRLAALRAMDARPRHAISVPTEEAVMIHGKPRVLTAARAPAVSDMILSKAFAPCLGPRRTAAASIWISEPLRARSPLTSSGLARTGDPKAER